MTDQPTATQSPALKELASFRKLAEEQAVAVKVLQDLLEKTLEYRNLVKAKLVLQEYNDNAADLTTAIKASNASVITETIEGMDKDQRAAAFAEFKALLPVGLSLRVNHSLEYNEQDVITWCETNAPAILKTVLDKKPFEALAESKDIPGVKKIDVPTITIASDLSPYLL